jgi:predicted short-subunit dehydrogenase-like oxidoreductase (DUF2520 family)
VRQDLAKATIALVGVGRAGRAFARSWTAAGGSIVLVARAPASARAFARRLPRARVRSLGGGEVTTIAGDVLVLAVPDDAIAPLARRLVGRVAARFAFHFSGALGSGELAPLRSGGAKLGSLHPLRAFTGAPAESWRGALVAVEGDDDAVTAALRMCRRIGARPRRLATSGKPLYHAAATLAAGGAASLISVATRLWREAGLSEAEGRKALAALAAGALDAVGRFAFEQALTGPVARRDVETVRLHGRALEPWPEIRELYALLAGETLRRTAGRGREREIAAALAGDGAGRRPRSPRASRSTAKQSDKGGRTG